MATVSPAERRALRPRTGATGNTGRELEGIERVRMRRAAPAQSAQTAATPVVAPPSAEDIIMQGMDQPVHPISQVELPAPMRTGGNTQLNYTPARAPARVANAVPVARPPVAGSLNQTAQPASSPGAGINDGQLQQPQTQQVVPADPFTQSLYGNSAVAADGSAQSDGFGLLDLVRGVGTAGALALPFLAGPRVASRMVGQGAGAMPPPGSASRAVGPAVREVEGEVIPPSRAVAPQGVTEGTGGNSFNPNYRPQKALPAPENRTPNTTAADDVYNGLESPRVTGRSGREVVNKGSPQNGTIRQGAPAQTKALPAPDTRQAKNKTTTRDRNARTDSRRAKTNLPPTTTAKRAAEKSRRRSDKALRGQK